VRLQRWQRQILDRAAREASLLPLSDAVATLATTLAVHLLQGGAVPDIAPTHEVRVRLDSLADIGGAPQVLAILVPVGTSPSQETTAASDRWNSFAVPADDDTDGAAWDTVIDAELGHRRYLRVGPTLHDSRIAVVPVRLFRDLPRPERSSTENPSLSARPRGAGEGDH
jgi:hypothetical protein